MIKGLSRLVNPYRGLCYAVNNGRISLRSKDLELWQLFVLDDLNREVWAEGKMNITKRGLKRIAPEKWRWKFFLSSGDIQEYQGDIPSRNEFLLVIETALEMTTTNFYPLIDPYELWVCEASGNPLFLALTSHSLKRLAQIASAPFYRVRYGETSQGFSAAAHLDFFLDSARDLEAEINRSAARFRLFKRNLDSSAVEFFPDRKDFSVQFPYGFLPEGQLAEPYQSKYNAI